MCSLLIIYCHTMETCVSGSPTHFNVYFFLLTQLSFRFLSEKIIPYVVVDSFYLWEELRLGSSYVAILNKSPLNPS